MKTISLTSTICLLLLVGCSSVTQNVTEQAHVLSAGYVHSMQAGKTTPAQDQQHILATHAEICTIDAAVRGTAAEQATESLVNPAATTKGN